MSLKTQSIEALDNLIQEMKKEISAKMKEADELDKEMKELRDDIDKLLIHLGQIESVKNDLVPKEKSNTKKIRSYLGHIKSPVGITRAIRIIFIYSEKHSFDAVELARELAHLQEKKLLDSRSTNLVWSTHSALRQLLKKNFLIRFEVDGNTKYRTRSSFLRLLKSRRNDIKK